jgi:hypothetical protein
MVPERPAWCPQVGAEWGQILYAPGPAYLPIGAFRARTRRGHAGGVYQTFADGPKPICPHCRPHSVDFELGPQGAALDRSGRAGAPGTSAVNTDPAPVVQDVHGISPAIGRCPRSRRGRSRSLAAPMIVGGWKLHGTSGPIATGTATKLRPVRRCPSTSSPVGRRPLTTSAGVSGVSPPSGSARPSRRDAGRQPGRGDPAT